MWILRKEARRVESRPTAAEIWWSLNVLMGIRAVLGVYRAFLSPKSPLARERRA